MALADFVLLVNNNNRRRNTSSSNNKGTPSSFSFIIKSDLNSNESKVNFKMVPLKTLTINKKYSEYAYDLFPLAAEKYNIVKSDIAKSGILSPLSINKNGVVLDGHHRYRIACQLGVKDIPVSIMEFADPLDELAFVVRINMLRKHLNDLQLASIGCELLKIESLKARHRQLATLRRSNKNNNISNRSILPSAPIGTDQEKDSDIIPIDNGNEKSGRADQIVANLIGMKMRTFQRAKIVLEKADPGMKEEVLSDKMSISRAESIIRHKENKQARKDKLIADAEANNYKNFHNTTERYQLFLGDFRSQNVQKYIADDSIDLIFTDPPYRNESLHLYADLGDLAFRVLKPGGSLITYAGHYALPQIFKYMEKSKLTYWWLIIVDHSGHSVRMHKQRVWAYYKPLLWFVKGDRNNAPEDIGDLIKSESSNKIDHEWQQSEVEADYCIKHLTVEGQTVLDPFLGSGTTGLATLKINRKFIGVEKDPEHFETCKMKINNLLAAKK